jgi:hypothetical protein
MGRALRRGLTRGLAVVACSMAAGAGHTARSEDIPAARACSGIGDQATRLACYDAAFGSGGPTAGVRSAAPAPRPAAPPWPDAPSPEARFGDNGQLHAELKAKAAASLPKSLTSKVLSAMRLPQGLYRLTLDNGQIWQTREADWALDFKSSDEVTVSRLALGGYQVSMAGNARSVGVKRIQ